MAIILLMVFSIGLNASTVSRSGSCAQFSRSCEVQSPSFLKSAIAQRLQGGVVAIGDFDGDKAWDFVIAQAAGHEFRILVALSSSSAVVPLSPIGRSVFFSVSVCDINNDSFQDIVLSSPTALPPQAVWLGDGKGNFVAADHDALSDDLVLTDKPGVRSAPRQIETDLLFDSSHPVYEKTNRIFCCLEPDGFIIDNFSLSVRHVPNSLLTLRSPPHIPFS